MVEEDFDEWVDGDDSTEVTEDAVDDLVEVLFDDLFDDLNGDLDLDLVDDLDRFDLADDLPEPMS